MFDFVFYMNKKEMIFNDFSSDNFNKCFPIGYNIFFILPKSIQISISIILTCKFTEINELK